MSDFPHTGPKSSDWRGQAACAGEDPEIFFPLSELSVNGTEAALARLICRRCPVIVSCRTWAIENGEDAGIWGATTAAQRRAIRRAAESSTGSRPVARPYGGGPAADGSAGTTTPRDRDAPITGRRPRGGGAHGEPPPPPG